MWYRSVRSRISLIVFGVVILLLGGLVTAIGFSGNTLFEMGGIACSILGVILILAGIFWKKHLFRFEVWGTAWVLPIGEFENIRPALTVGPDLKKVVEELGALLIEIQDGTLYSGE